MKYLLLLSMLLFCIPSYAKDPVNNIESQKAAQAWLDSTEKFILASFYNNLI